MRLRRACFLCLVGVVSLAGEVTILWPDVEQGACMLVMGPETEGVRVGILIDVGTGYSVAPEEPPTEAIGCLLAEDPRIQIKYTLLTHFHSDHYSWFLSLKASGLLAPDCVEYTRYTVEPGQTIDLGSGAILQVLVASGWAWTGAEKIQVTSASDENTLSVGGKISYGEFQAWVGGDLTATVEVKIASYIGDVDLYVLHHHGSHTSSSLTFLRALRLEVAVCQVGDGNPYGHPYSITLRNVLSTADTDGNPMNGTPLLILQNRRSYAGGYSQVLVADPDGPGGSPGVIRLSTDGSSYAITIGTVTLTFSVDEITLSGSPR